MPDLAVILPAAGTSARFGADKLAAMLAGKSVLQRSIDAFANRGDVKLIILAGREVPSAHQTGFLTCPGGTCRAETVRNAVALVPHAIEWVAVHDAARPLVSGTLIDRVFEEAQRHGAAAPATPIELTVKQAVGPLPSSVVRTVPRNELWAMQTPQIMRRADLSEAFGRCPIPLDQVTDDVQLLELLGKPVRLIAGDERNLKITRPIHIQMAEILLSNG